jgi:hypothetical protein
MKEAAEEDAGSSEEYKGECDLGDEERAAQVAGAASGAAGAVVEG